MSSVGFRDFTTSQTDCPSGASVFSFHRLGGGINGAAAVDAPVLLLMHGYPQNHLMWRDFVPEIPMRWNVLVIDLPGYNLSTKPIHPDNPGFAHSKREWAKDIVHVVDSVFSNKAPIVAFGHDRGARTGYRMALDFPDRVIGAAILDIVPTPYVWDAMRLERGHKLTHAYSHWIFLAGRRPFPETMIASNPSFYFRFGVDAMISAKTKALAETSHWVVDSIQPFLDPVRGKDRIIAGCEDYRAGATHDIEIDKASGIDPFNLSINPIFKLPLLVLYGAPLGSEVDVPGIWTKLTEPGKIDVFQIGDEHTSHFFVNEKPEEVGKRMRDWLEKNFA